MAISVSAKSVIKAKPMQKIIQVWNPVAEGLSVSALNLWLIDRVAFEIQYLRGYEAVEDWNKSTNYGKFIQAGIEGFIKTRETRGISKFIHNEFVQQIHTYDKYDEIAWWASLADKQVNVWRSLYEDDLNSMRVDKSEAKYESVITLPSGRQIKLKGYIDGESPSGIMENKCRGDWDEDTVTQQIHLDLQYNYYLMLFYTKHGTLPQYVWYQHIRRPGGYGSKSPRRKKNEPDSEFLLRTSKHIAENTDYYFFRLLLKPTMDEFARFNYSCLYPILEAFIDWYCYMTHPTRETAVNNCHWMTPYGLYNPFLEGTQERFRNYRMHGSTRGLRPRKAY